MIRHFVTVSFAALAVACSPGAPPAEGEGAGAEPVAAPVADAQTLRPDGWGPLRIGMSRAEVEAALGPDANPEAVGGPDPAACDEFRPARAPAGLLVMIENGVLTRISATGPGLATAEGFGVGAAADAVQAALGAGATFESHKYAEAPAGYILSWTTPQTAPYVEDPAARGVLYEIGPEGTVVAVRVGGPSIQYVEGCL